MDLPVSPLSIAEKVVELIYSIYSNAKIISLGGDHSISYPLVKKYLLAKQSSLKDVAIIHFDAHTDAYHNLDHFLGAVKSAAHWASYLVRDGHVDAEHSVQIGIRGNVRTLDWLEPSYDLGYEVIDIRRLREIGVDAAIEIINQRITQHQAILTNVELNRVASISLGTEVSKGFGGHDQKMWVKRLCVASVILPSLSMLSHTRQKT